ncbi:hypothetical protein JNUCC31_04380 [Paenibacillus sp. JNUCC31]|uniref:hypothetical protein n=1 Tax=Paenibacillus sp. JNUCC-31 TaxID=2777983 RepID=UPI0017869B72|nr:hypothetical protein [Paenibacillus sp. JNUCC-31]QOS80182.1 hypothetical protein JNUCC31_04380 [Paenibacillus sp. JNUCC-31]
MLQLFMTWLILILVLVFLWEGVKKTGYGGAKSNFRRWGGWFIGIFVLGTAPLGYALYTELKGGYIGANIGFGLALLFVWAYCALLLCVGLFLWGRYAFKQYRKK